MHSGGSTRYATAASWDSFNQNGRKVEWSGAELFPLTSIIAAAAARVSARTRTPLTKMHLLETGCGTSGLSQSVAKWLPDCKVSASDFAATVIDDMQRQGEDQELQGTVSWLVADATSLPFESESLHMVFAKTLLDCLRTVGGASQDLVFRMLREAHRVLVPGGALVLFDKHGPKIHWSIRSSRSFELMCGEKRHWYCHELRKVVMNNELEDGSKTMLPALCCPSNYSEDRGCEIRMEVSEKYHGLAVRKGPWSTAVPLKVTTPHSGDLVIEVNGVDRRDTRRMAKLISDASESRPAHIMLHRPIGPTRDQGRLAPLHTREQQQRAHGGASTLESEGGIHQDKIRRGRSEELSQSKEWYMVVSSTLAPPNSPCCDLDSVLSAAAIPSLTDITEFFR